MVGGFAGNASLTANNSYNAGTITTTSSDSPYDEFVGTGSASYTNCYGLSSGISMQSQSFADTLNQNRGEYSEWAYDTNKNQGYPYLLNNN